MYGLSMVVMASLLTASSPALVSSHLKGFENLASRDQQPYTIGQGITEYGSLSAAQHAADRMDIIAYVPSSGKALVMESMQGRARSPGGAEARFDFLVDCPGNGSAKDQPVRTFNAAYLGTVTLRCGTAAGGGYEHISSGHGKDWENKLAQVGSTSNWAKFMMWVSDEAFTTPYSGYPKNRDSNDTLCYSTPVYLRTQDGKVNADFNPTVITGNRSRNMVTSFPSRYANC